MCKCYFTTSNFSHNLNYTWLNKVKKCANTFETKYNYCTLFFVKAALQHPLKKGAINIGLSDNTRTTVYAPTSFFLAS